MKNEKMKNIFQTEYPQETIDELLAWIDTDPQGEIELGHGIHINDISLFAKNMRHILQTQSKNSCYAGQIETLLRAKMAWDAQQQSKD